MSDTGPRAQFRSRSPSGGTVVAVHGSVFSDVITTLIDLAVQWKLVVKLQNDLMGGEHDEEAHLTLVEALGKAMTLEATAGRVIKEAYDLFDAAREQGEEQE